MDAAEAAGTRPREATSVSRVAADAGAVWLVRAGSPPRSWFRRREVVPAPRLGRARGAAGVVLPPRPGFRPAVAARAGLAAHRRRLVRPSAPRPRQNRRTRRGSAPVWPAAPALSAPAAVARSPAGSG